MGCVYFVRGKGTDLYKIGITGGELSTRLSMIQTGCPYELETVQVFETPKYKALEKRLHRAFDEQRQNGEWFELDAAEVEDVLEAGTKYVKKHPLRPKVHRHRITEGSAKQGRISLGDYGVTFWSKMIPEEDLLIMPALRFEGMKVRLDALYPMGSPEVYITCPPHLRTKEALCGLAMVYEPEAGLIDSKSTWHIVRPLFDVEDRMLHYRMTVANIAGAGRYVLTARNKVMWCRVRPSLSGVVLENESFSYGLTDERAKEVFVVAEVLAEAHILTEASQD